MTAGGQRQGLTGGRRCLLRLPAGLLGCLNLLGTDVIRPGLGQIRVRGRAAHRAWIALGESHGELGGQPGVAAATQLRLLLTSASGGRLRLLRCGPRRGHLFRETGGGAGLLQPGGGLIGGGLGITETLPGGAGGIPGGDQGSTYLGAGLDLGVEIGEFGAGLLQCGAALLQALLPTGKILLQLDQGTELTGPGGGLLDRGSQRLQRARACSEVGQLGVVLAVAGQSGIPFLLPGLEVGAGLVASGNGPGDGLGDAVVVKAGASGGGGLLLGGEGGGQLVEGAAAVDPLQADGGGLRGAAGLALLRTGRLGSACGFLGGAGRALADLVGLSGELLEAVGAGVALQLGAGVVLLQAGGLDEAGQGLVEAGGGGVDLLGGLAAHLLELLLDVLVDLGAEHALQHGLPVAGAGAQEAGELVLGQQDRLRELGAGEAHGRADLAAHFVQPGGDRREAGTLAGGVGEHLVDQIGGAEAPQQGLGVLLDGALAALLGPVVLGLAQHAVHAVGGLEDQVDDAGRGGLGELGADALPAGTFPGHAAVQGVDHRVQHGGLAGAGGALEQEHAAGTEGGEVDADLVAERPDAPHAQVMQLHEASCPRVRTVR